MFWVFLLGVFYLGTDDQLLQILHALHLWQESGPPRPPPKKQVLGLRGGGGNKEKKKFSPNPNQRKITNRRNEWQPPRGTTFLFGYYLKGNHDNIHAKETGDKICFQIWSLGFHSPVFQPPTSLYCANVSAVVFLMYDRMLLLVQSWLTNGVSCVTMWYMDYVYHGIFCFRAGLWDGSRW